MVERSTSASPELTAWVASRYGVPVVAALPEVRPDADHAEAFDHLLIEVAEAPVVLFPGIRSDRLDGFFHLRLAQVLRTRSPLQALSVVAVSPGRNGSRLASGFSRRFRSSWPFAGCVFITDSGNPRLLSAELGLPVHHAFDPAAAPAIFGSQARADQQIALQLQPIFGNTVGSENQIDSLVRAGFLTIRLSMDGKLRRGPSLNAALERVIPENGAHAGAHISLVSVPQGPPVWIGPGDGATTWATRLAREASCAVYDTAVLNAARRAHSVVATQIERVGSALVLAPQARLLLDMLENRPLSERVLALSQGATEAQAATAEAQAASAQARVLAIPDICSFVNATEAQRLGSHCQRRATVPLRVYVEGVDPAEQPTFDVVVTGDLHPFNIESLRWFLDDVWRPHLTAAPVSVAIVGQVADGIDAAFYASPSLHFLGSVENFEAVRSQCRVTVVADRAGNGVSIKLLTALAVGHPVATTSVGLRGLEPLIATLLPAHDNAAGLADDILCLVTDPQHLEQRRAGVREAQRAIHQAMDHAECVASIAPPTASVREARAARWAELTAAAMQVGPEPYHFDLDSTFPMSGCAWDAQVLLDGWHEAEPWGRWSDGGTASLRMTLARPATEPLRLVLDIVPSPIGASLSIVIEDAEFPPIEPVQGSNGWDIPMATSQGKSSLLLTLRVAGTVCPARVSGVADERILGIGVSAVRLCSRQPTLCEVGTGLPINAGTKPREVLVDGWHPLEHWGCWSNGREASLTLTFAEPLAGLLWLEMQLSTPPAGTMLTLTVNGTLLAPIIPENGTSAWALPEDATDGRGEIRIELQTSSTFCPAEFGGSTDDRTLGIGIRSVGVYAAQHDHDARPGGRPAASLRGTWVAVR